MRSASLVSHRSASTATSGAIERVTWAVPPSNRRRRVRLDSHSLGGEFCRILAPARTIHAHITPTAECAPTAVVTGGAAAAASTATRRRIRADSNRTCPHRSSAFVCSAASLITIGPHSSPPLTLKEAALSAAAMVATRTPWDHLQIRTATHPTAATLTVAAQQSQSRLICSIQHTRTDLRHEIEKIETVLLSCDSLCVRRKNAC